MKRRGRHPAQLLASLLFAVLVGLAASAGTARAHAEPEQANVPIDGVVPTAPATLAVTFSQEVSPTGLVLTVTGPTGERVDQGDAALDLDDLERRRVTVSLTPALGPGVYTVYWQTASVTDGEAAEGTFTFTVQGAGASPASSPVSTPVAAPAVVGTPAPIPSPAATTVRSTPDTTSVAGIPLPVIISVGVGAVAAAAIWLFWQRVRPVSPR